VPKPNYTLSMRKEDAGLLRASDGETLAFTHHGGFELAVAVVTDGIMAVRCCVPRPKPTPSCWDLL
jgi:hypothetical protein